jgi:hypothetical protein
LAFLIDEEKVPHTGYDVEGEKDAVVASLYRRSQTPDALNNLAILVEEEKTDKDEKGKKIVPGTIPFVAARLYRLSGTPKAIENRQNLEKEQRALREAARK